MNMRMIKADTRHRARRVYFADWKYEVGQEAEFGEMSVVILGRQRTAMGRQLYHIRIVGECAGRPYRVVAM